MGEPQIERHEAHSVNFSISQLNVIKTNKRTSLSNESLDDLLLLTTDSVPLREFCPDEAIDLWWRDKVRRPNQSKRKQYKECTRNLTTHESTVSSSESETEPGSKEDSDAQSDLLSDWDEWMSVSSWQ